MVEKAVVPNGQLNKLRGCMSCSLVKTVHQFSVDGCENCRFLDRDRMMDWTSGKFSGIYSLMSPKESWVAKWQRVGHFRPGCYAIAVDGQLPEDIVEDSMPGRRPGRTRATQQRT